MALTAVNLTPRVGSELKIDLQSLLSGEHGADIRRLLVERGAAYDDLPDDEKAHLDTLKVVHTMQAALFPAKPTCSPEEFAVLCAYPEREHPLVWRHKSGRKSLVLSTSGSHAVGMHPALSHEASGRMLARFTLNGEEPITGVA